MLGAGALFSHKDGVRMSQNVQAVDILQSAQYRFQCNEVF